MYESDIHSKMWRPADSESGACFLDGGVGVVGHVSGLRGAGALHAHQRHRLLERMERRRLLGASEQQRYGTGTAAAAGGPV